MLIVLNALSNELLFVLRCPTCRCAVIETTEAEAKESLEVHFSKH